VSVRDRLALAFYLFAGLFAAVAVGAGTVVFGGSAAGGLTAGCVAAAGVTGALGWYAMEDVPDPPEEPG